MILIRPPLALARGRNACEARLQPLAIRLRPLLATQGFAMKSFDWHAAPISRATVITRSYTQNVRRFFLAQCGDSFRFDRPFMAWLRDGAAKTMGDAADEWLRRQAEKRKA